MRKEVKYFSKQELELKADVDGAKMWAVSLEKTQFTYFEVEPDKIFEMHSHESEQITHVLSGKLYFEFEDDIKCVSEGEVIAIPSNIPHAVFTRDLAAKAVDAWSPVMDKYSG
ncbi:MAG: cupin domain-containing protein [Flavobacteriaceae bacterium]